MKVAFIERNIRNLYKFTEQLKLYNKNYIIEPYKSTEEFEKKNENINDFNLIISVNNLGKRNTKGIEYFRLISNSFNGKLILLSYSCNYKLKKQILFKKITLLNINSHFIEIIKEKFFK